MVILVLGKEWTKIEQWGTSLVIPIPQDIAKALNIKHNTEVSIEVRHGELRIGMSTHY